MMEQRTRQICARDLKLVPNIRRLMGETSFASFALRDCDEVMDFRRALTMERLSWYGERQELWAQDAYRLPRYFCDTLSRDVFESVGNINVEGHLKLPEINATKMINLVCSTTADVAKDVLFDAILKTLPSAGGIGISSSQYIMKLPGLQEYFYGDIPLLRFDHIRSALSSSSRISLRLVPLAEVLGAEKDVDDPQGLADLLLSQDMTRPKEFVDPPVSIFTLTQKLTLTVNKVEGIPESAFETREEEDDKKREKSSDLPRLLAIQASVMYGDLELDHCQTKWVPASTSPTWPSVDGTLEFKSVTIQNISPGSRVCFSLLMMVGDRLIPLFWVNMQLIFHDSMSNTWSLRTGDQAMHMWKEGKNGEVNLYKSIGICSENVCEPGPRLLIACPSFSFDVVFPPPPRDMCHEEVLRRLSSPGSYDVKKDLFDLKERLKEAGFREPFLENNGMRVLCNLVRDISGNMLAYCLAALEVALEVSLTIDTGFLALSLSLSVLCH